MVIINRYRDTKVTLWLRVALLLESQRSLNRDMKWLINVL